MSHLRDLGLFLVLTRVLWGPCLLQKREAKEAKEADKALKAAVKVRHGGQLPHKGRLSHGVSFCMGAIVA